MEKDFDPYHRWLGIPPQHQPPNHYRLLGLELFESDLDVIETAADRQMAHVRGFQSGKRGNLTQGLLNEIASAKQSLLNPESKSTYDRRLKEHLKARKEKKDKRKNDSVAQSQTQSPSPVLQDGAQASAPVAIKTKPRSLTKRSKQKGVSLPLILCGAGGAAVVLLVIAVVALTRGNSEDPSSTSAAEQESAEPPSTRAVAQNAEANGTGFEEVPDLPTTEPDPLTLGGASSNTPPAVTTNRRPRIRQQSLS